MSIFNSKMETRIREEINVFGKSRFYVEGYYSTMVIGVGEPTKDNSNLDWRSIEGIFFDSLETARKWIAEEKQKLRNKEIVETKYHDEKAPGP